jgi:hypothetical protein
MNTREQIAKQLEAESLNASDKLDALRQQLAHETDPARRRVLSIKIAAAAEERNALLQAYFATPRTL